eukprot:c26121_g1_i4 orf=95-418(-)
MIPFSPILFFHNQKKAVTVMHNLWHPKACMTLEGKMASEHLIPVLTMCSIINSLMLSIKSCWQTDLLCTILRYIFDSDKNCDEAQKKCNEPKDPKHENKGQISHKQI